MELHVVQLIVRLFHLTALTDLILCYSSLLYYWSSWTEYSFLRMLSSFVLSSLIPSKNSDCKIQITAKKNFNLRYFINIFFISTWCFRYRLPNTYNIVVTWVKLLGPPSSIQITYFCGNLSKVVRQTSQHPIVFLKEVV